MTTKKPRVYLYEGTVNPCAHQVNFWFRGAHRINDDLKQRLKEEAEQRAKSQIIEGYISGELCYTTSDKHEHEYRGWWEIND
jgi:hypothetical protein